MRAEIVRQLKSMRQRLAAWALLALFFSIVRPAWALDFAPYSQGRVSEAQLDDYRKAVSAEPGLEHSVVSEERLETFNDDKTG